MGRVGNPDAYLMNQRGPLRSSIAQVPLQCSLDLCQCVSTAIIQHLFHCVKVHKVANHQKK